MTQLRDPFDVTHTKRVGNADLTYVSWSQVADRLDEASPGWGFQILQLGPDWCHGRLTLGSGQSFENIGYAENADADWKKEPLKDAASDALKRCAALAGVARYLYDKDDNSARRSSPSRSSGGTGTSSPASSRGGTAGPTPLRPAATTVPPEPEGLMDDEPAGGGQCPVHHKDWRRNSRGWYCATKNNDGSWCDEHPSQAWMASA